MEKSTAAAGVVPAAIVEEAWQQVGASFEWYCLTVGITTLAGMMEADAARLVRRALCPWDGRDGHRWGRTKEKLPKPLHASVRKVLRQPWELDDADKAERLITNLARRLEQQAPGVAASILEGLDEILTVIRLGLPAELRRSLACTNIIENMMGTVRRVCRNVKRWRDASMALRWTSAAMLEAAKGFRRLKAHKQLSALRTALAAHHVKHLANSAVEPAAK